MISDFKGFHVLITDYVHPKMIQQFSSWGATVDYQPSITRQEVLAYGQNVQVLVINSKIRANQELIDQHPFLCCVARLGSGLDIIDLPLCADRNIAVVSAPEGNRLAVAEHALGMILMFLHRLKSAQQAVLQSPWPREVHRGSELSGKSVGIVGYGHTGSQFAKLLQPFGCEIKVYDPYKPHIHDPTRSISKVNDFIDLMSSDIISLHVPLTDETHHMIDAEVLRRIKPSALLVNTSRGKVIDTLALLHALQANQLAGACLDVVEQEKAQMWTREELQMYSALFTLPQVIASPHVAGWTTESYERITDVLLAKISARFITN